MTRVANIAWMETKQQYVQSVGTIFVTIAISITRGNQLRGSALLTTYHGD